MPEKIYKKTCPECGKEISSLNKGQFEYNYQQHIDSHKRKEKKKEKKCA